MEECGSDLGGRVAGRIRSVGHEDAADSGAV